MDAYEISGRIYPAKSARLELIDLVKEVMHASYQTGDRVSIPRTIMDRVVGDLEHAVQILDALQDERATISRLTAERDEARAACQLSNDINANLRAVNDRLRAELEGMRTALELIAAHKGKTIFSMEPAYREGANAAYEQLADIASAALTPSTPSEGDKP